MKISKSQLREIIREEISMMDANNLLMSKLKSMKFQIRPERDGLGGTIMARDLSDMGKPGYSLVVYFGPLSFDSDAVSADRAKSLKNKYTFNSALVPFKVGILSKLISKLSGTKRLDYSLQKSLMGTTAGQSSDAETYIDLGSDLFALTPDEFQSKVESLVKMSIQRAKSVKV